MVCGLFGCCWGVLCGLLGVLFGFVGGFCSFACGDFCLLGFFTEDITIFRLSLLPLKKLLDRKRFLAQLLDDH